MCDLWRISGTTAIPVTVCCLLTVVVGYPIFGEFIPNGHRVPDPCHKDKVWEPVGHQGFLKRSPLNAFGVDFARSRSWDKHLCELDSDGDGRTNGEELGDPMCIWASGSTSNITANYSLSHPGICEPLDSSRCLSRNLWLNGCRPFTCPALNDTDVRSTRLSLPQEVAIPPAGMDTTGVLAYPWRTPGRRTICMKMALPSAEKDYHVIGSQPVLTPSLLRHVEDIALYTCEEDSAHVIADLQFDCDDYPRNLGIKLGCYSIIAAWSWNGPAGECHPTLYGFRIGRRTYRSAILRVRMRSYRATETRVKGAGIVIFYTDRLRPNDAGTLVIDASTITAGPTGSRLGRCRRPKENRNCTGGDYPTTINIARAVVVTDNFDGARITVDVERKSVSIRKLLEWKDFWDPNSYSSIDLPNFEPDDEVVLNCATHSSALFCLSRIIYYPAISQLGYCDGALPADIIPSAACARPGVGSVCRVGLLLNQSTNIFTTCPWKPEACLNLCELVFDAVLTSGCSWSDLEVQSRSFSQLLRYLDFMQHCSSSTGITRAFPIQNATTTLSPFWPIPDNIFLASAHSDERELLRKRSRGHVDRHTVVDDKLHCSQNASDAFLHLQKLTEDVRSGNPEKYNTKLVRTCRDVNLLKYVCGCRTYSSVCVNWKAVCSIFRNSLFLNVSSSKSTASSNTFATQSIDKSSRSSVVVTQITLGGKRGPVETASSKTFTTQSINKSSRSSVLVNQITLGGKRGPVETASSKTFTTQSINKSSRSSVLVNQITLGGKRGPVETASSKTFTTQSINKSSRSSSIAVGEITSVPVKLRHTTKSVSTDRSTSNHRVDYRSTLHFTRDDPIQWRSSTMSADRTSVSTDDWGPSAEVSTASWSKVYELDDVSAVGIAHGNVGKSMSASAAKATANIFTAWSLQVFGLLCARFVLDGLHLLDRF